MGVRSSLTVPLVFLTVMLFAAVVGWGGAVSVQAWPAWTNADQLCEVHSSKFGFVDNCSDFCFFASCNECCLCHADSPCPPPKSGWLPSIPGEGGVAGFSALVSRFAGGVGSFSSRLGFGVSTAFAAPGADLGNRNYSGCSDASVGGDGNRDVRSGTGCGHYTYDCSPCLHWHWFFNNHNAVRGSFDVDGDYPTGYDFFVDRSATGDAYIESESALGLHPGVVMPGSGEALRYGGSAVDASFDCREGHSGSEEFGWEEPGKTAPPDPALGVWGSPDGTKFVFTNDAHFGYMTSMDDSGPIDSVRPGDFLFNATDSVTGVSSPVYVPGELPVQVDGSTRFLSGDVPVDAAGALSPVTGGAPVIDLIEGVEIETSLDARVRLGASNVGGRALHYRFWVHDGFEPFVANLPFRRLSSLGTVSSSDPFGIYPVQVHPQGSGPVSSWSGLPSAPVGQFSFQIAARGSDGVLLRSNVLHVRVGYLNHPWVQATPVGGPTSVHGNVFPTPNLWRPEMLQTATRLPTVSPAPSMTPVSRPAGIRIQRLERIPLVPGGVNLFLVSGVTGSFQYRAIPYNGSWGDEIVQPWEDGTVRPGLPLPVLDLLPGVVYVFTVRVVDPLTELASPPSPVDMILTWSDTFTPQVSWFDSDPDTWVFDNINYDLMSPTPPPTPRH